MHPFCGMGPRIKIHEEKKAFWLLAAVLNIFLIVRKGYKCTGKKWDSTLWFLTLRPMSFPSKYFIMVFFHIVLYKNHSSDYNLVKSFLQKNAYLRWWATIPMGRNWKGFQHETICNLYANQCTFPPVNIAKCPYAHAAEALLEPCNQASRPDCYAQWNLFSSWPPIKDSRLIELELISTLFILPYA